MDALSIFGVIFLKSELDSSEDFSQKHCPCVAMEVHALLKRNRPDGRGGRGVVWLHTSTSSLTKAEATGG